MAHRADGPAEGPRDARRPDAVRDVLVVVLAATSGATDAIGFLALGGAFTSVMTGNMVLLGVGVGHGDLMLLWLTLTALTSFVVGAAVGARITGPPHPDDGWWPGAITYALLAEAALFGLFAAAWWGFGAKPPEDAMLALLGLNAVALGLQSSAMRRFGVAGLSTTYLTGTLTTVVVRLTGGQRSGQVGHSLWIMAGLVTGAIIGALLVRHLPVAVPLAPLGTLLAVVATATVTRRLITARTASR